MASREEKDKLVQRHARYHQRAVGREEQQRRERAAKARRATSRGERRRRDDWDEDDAGFEKIRRPASGPPAPPPPARPELPRHTVAAVHRGRIELDDGRSARVAVGLVVAGVRVVVGDEVAVADVEGVPRIEQVAPRRSWLGRPDPGDPRKQLLLAANVDRAVIVVAVADPPLHPGLIDRMLFALGDGGVAPVICANKSDLLDDAAAIAAVDRQLAPYEQLQLPVFRCSAARADGIEALREHLRGTTCVFVGHSGVGKSSLLNVLDPDGHRRVGDVRRNDGRGRHTTTSSSLRQLGDGTRIIDTPGIRAFGPADLQPTEVLAGFPEFAAFAAGCRFGDCTHVHEPDCAVRAAVADGRLAAHRHASYLRILASLAET